ncbi:hypothetical protein E0493_11730 [Roseomonas sp. M0104]|uniref:Uncharacterized protein n=1 Tax=Teichococcus coralli TaxID=2545983 RepID=A0A845BD88_9PROT|nr:hypothetical protein [Pseudoroseomonas coralli]MXP64014.1 hypothetical protein [Pseudoroseomonas coralli]
MGDYQTGVRITLQGVDDAAVEMAADELKQRLGARFAVTARRRRQGQPGLSITATMLMASAANVDAAASDLLDRLYAGRG